MATNQEAQTNQGPQRQSPKYEISTLSRAFSKNASYFQKVSRAAVLAALIFISLSTIVSAFHVQSPRFSLLGYRIGAYTAIAAGFFLVASLIRLYRNVRNPERIWFGSRVLAERTRSLGWRYAVAGVPFPKQSEEPDSTDARYQQALESTATEASEGGIRYPTPSGKASIHVITDWMRQTRAKSLEQRRAIYAQERIQNQENFHAKRAEIYNRAMIISQWILYGIETTGALLAALIALSIIQLDLVGVAGTVAAGVAAWVQFNQFTELAATYSAIAYRMAGYRERSLNNSQSWTEDRWAAFVDEVENSLAEEHGAWRHIMQQGAADTP